MVGMWLNCIFGGKGVGMINMLIYVIIGIFVAGMMVGRTPEYLGKKIGAREVKLAIVTLLVHPFMILLPTGLFAATSWGLLAVSNPGAHGLSQMLYQFSSASANNGSAFDGLGVVYGFANNPNPAPTAMAWDIAAGLVIIFGRYLPIVAPIAMAASLGAKKSRPLRPWNAPHGHRDLRGAPPRDDPHRRRPALPAGRRAGTAGRAFRPHPLRRLMMPQPDVQPEKCEKESRGVAMNKSRRFERQHARGQNARRRPPPESGGAAGGRDRRSRR